MKHEGTHKLHALFHMMYYTIFVIYYSHADKYSITFKNQFLLLVKIKDMFDIFDLH